MWECEGLAQKSPGTFHETQCANQKPSLIMSNLGFFESKAPAGGNSVRRTNRHARPPKSTGSRSLPLVTAGRPQKAMEAAMLAETSEVQNHFQNATVVGRPTRIFKAVVRRTVSVAMPHHLRCAGNVPQCEKDSKFV